MSAPSQGPSWQHWLVTKMLGAESFTEIYQVDFRKRPVKSTDVDELSGLKWLKTLYADRAEIDNDNIYVLAGFNNLETLSLSYTKLSDRGFKQLQNLKNLQKLYLTGVAVSNDSVAVLCSMNSLRQLFIRWSMITADGAQRIQLGLPDCEIFHHEVRRSSELASELQPVAASKP